eukprot:Pompholyxophrys_sp_v1_NODE_37_length_3331_cov_9.873932.p1 type:complete len:348 gc:universal NODE_37_length_3331_cov_9.873932:2121-3164(+)
MPPFFLYKADGEGLLDDAPVGSDYYVTKKAYMTDEAWPFYIRHFVECIPPRPNGQHVLLLLDGYGSHEADTDLLEWLDKEKIVLFALPAHTSSALQPLDLSVFGPLKEYIRQAFQNWIEGHQGCSFNRLHFCSLFVEAWDKAHCPDNIKSGFEKGGIWPLNKDILRRVSSVCAESLEKLPIHVNLNDPTTTSMEDHLQAFPDDGLTYNLLLKNLNPSPRKLPSKPMPTEQLDTVKRVLSFPLRSKVATKRNRTFHQTPLARIMNSPKRIASRRQEEEKKKREETEKRTKAAETKRKRLENEAIEQAKKKRKEDGLNMEEPIRFTWLGRELLIKTTKNLLHVNSLRLV